MEAYIELCRGVGNTYNSLITALKKFIDRTKDIPSGDSEHVKTLSHLKRLISSLDGDLTAIVNKLRTWVSSGRP